MAYMPAGDQATWPSRGPPGAELGEAAGVAEGQVETWRRSGALLAIPVDEAGKLTSIGTARHVGGDCQPCVFWFRGDCTRGLKCDHCHVVHPGQKRKRIRPSKATRDWRRQREQVLMGADEFFEVVDLGLHPPAGGRAGRRGCEPGGGMSASSSSIHLEPPAMATPGGRPETPATEPDDGPAISFETIEWPNGDGPILPGGSSAGGDGRASASTALPPGGGPGFFYQLSASYFSF